MLLRIVATVYTYLPLAWMTFSSVASRQVPLLLPSPIIWSYHKKETCIESLISSIVTIQTCSDCLISSIVTIQTCSECLSWPKTNTRTSGLHLNHIILSNFALSLLLMLQVSSHRHTRTTFVSDDEPLLRPRFLSTCNYWLNFVRQSLNLYHSINEINLIMGS